MIKTELISFVRAPTMLVWRKIINFGRKNFLGIFKAKTGYKNLLFLYKIEVSVTYWYTINLNSEVNWTLTARKNDACLTVYSLAQLSGSDERRSGSCSSGFHMFRNSSGHWMPIFCMQIFWIVWKPHFSVMFWGHWPFVKKKKKLYRASLLCLEILSYYAMIKW